uniref:type II secretion system protein n=1 Tax=Candidatus Fimenecus sp. TaxID=3022888 RepID=UPI004029B560
MKFTNKKRGFTIVELIIVIAVIAVLAAVLIPVFSGLIQQGKDAEAKVVVNTLNKGLAMTTTKPATMQSALEAVETNVGINVAKLDETYAKTGNKILWDSEYNTFLFVTKSGEKVS